MTFIPENELERALMRAAKEPASRPEFYRLLLESDLFVLGQIEGRTGLAGRTDIQEDEHLQIASGGRSGKPFHPVFSSLARLKSQISDTQNYLAINGRSLFEATIGAAFILNPGAEYGKELLPNEISWLLNPSKPQTVTVEKPTQVLIGQPAIYPHDLVNALKATFARHSDILNAYLIQIAYSGSDQPSHPLIGVETVGDWPSISAEIGRVVAAVAADLVIDAMSIDRKEGSTGLSAALLKTVPFYSRRLPTA